MARRRGRRRSQSSLPVGDSVRIGRERQLASRRSSLLPRSMPPGPIQRSNDLLNNRSRLFVRRLSPKELFVRARRARSQARRSLLSLRLDTRSTVCSRRGERRQVMFARDVAGRRWAGSGPDMRRARRNRDSEFSCRR